MYNIKDGLLYLLKNRDVILKIAKDYYYNSIDTATKNMRDKYKNLSEEDIEKMKKYQKIIEKRRNFNYQIHYQIH